MIRRSSLIMLEVFAGLLAAVLIALGVGWWRLSQGPVDLNFIREHVQAELSEAREGRPVGIERVELAWSQEGGALELRAVGVTVQDAAGAVLSRSDEARIELSVLPLLIGRVSVESADFSGGDLSITRKINGAVHLAFGPAGAPPDIIVPPPPENETLEQRVNRLLDGMEAAFRPVGPGGRLRSVSVRGARLSIVDEGGGGRWTADAASLEVARNGEALSFASSARLEGAEGSAPASLRITTDTAFQTAIVEFGANEVRPRALLSPAALGPFAGLDAPLTATVSIGLDRQSGITRLEGEATLGRGVADMAGGQFNVSGGRMRGRYDIDTDELVIDQVTLAGSRTRVEGEVRVREASAILRADPNQPAPFNVSLPSARLDIPGVLSAPIDFTGVEVVGAIVSAERAIRFERLHAQTGEALIDATGRLYWAEAGGRTRTGIAMDATVTGAVTTEQVFHLWPIKLGESAREYLARSISGGSVTNLTARLDIRPSDLAAEAFRNEAVDVRFDVAGAQMQFIQTMSPLTNARGSAILRGNRFDMQVPEARLNNLAVSRGVIELPRLKPRGAMMTISARAEGDARNIVEVLRQEPLDLDDEIPVDPASVSGRGQVNLSLQRPMLAQVPFEQWRFNIDGRIENFAGNMSTRRMALSQGQLAVRGDQRAITVSGPIRAGTSDVTLEWTETLNQRRGSSSRYTIAGDFDANDLVRLGYPIADYAEGRVGVTVRGEGRGFDMNQGNIEIDLRSAAVESPWAFWTKRAGAPSTIRFDLAREENGVLALNNLEARGGGLTAQGRVRVRGDDIIEADLPRLAVEGRSDARLRATRGADNGLDIAISGALFDAAPFMDNTDPPAGTAAAAAAANEPPVRAAIAVDRLKMRGGATLANARVDVATSRGALSRVIADGQSPGGRSFTLAMGPRPADPSGRIVFQSDDAGFATRALLGAENVVGGTVSADGTWRGGPPSRAEFDIHMRDFQIVRLPAMARLLSSAGSLTGLVEMLNGDGIGFTALDAPVVFANNRVVIGEARIAGPSLGLTGTGAYDIRRDNLDIDGVVVPSFGINSMLGALPVVGDLLVSRRGEGVVGMTYSVNGPVAEPRVGVNPLSALTPGIFRRIFEPVQRTPAPEPATPAPRAEAPAPRETASLPVGEGDAE